MKKNGDDNPVQRIALMAHEAALEASKWNAVVREVAQTLDVTGAALDGLPQPVWVLRGDAGIAFANSAAQALCRAALWLHVHRGRLAAVGDIEQPKLCEALQMTRLPGGRTCVTTWLEGGAARRAVLRIAPLAAESPYAAAWPSACALLVLELPVFEENQATWMLRSTRNFRLTEAETRVLHHFVTGAAPNEVAARCKLSIHTVRSHTRSIFEKRGCHRQAELMRLFGGA